MMKPKIYDSNICEVCQKGDIKYGICEISLFVKHKLTYTKKDEDTNNPTKYIIHYDELKYLKVCDICYKLYLYAEKEDDKEEYTLIPRNNNK